MVHSGFTRCELVEGTTIATIWSCSGMKHTQYLGKFDNRSDGTCNRPNCNDNIVSLRKGQSKDSTPNPAHFSKSRIFCLPRLPHQTRDYRIHMLKIGRKGQPFCESVEVAIWQVIFEQRIT